MIAAVNPSYCISTCFEWQCVFQYSTCSFKMSWSDQEKSSEWVRTEGNGCQLKSERMYMYIVNNGWNAVLHAHDTDARL